MRKRTAALVIVACGAWSHASRADTPSLPPPPPGGSEPRLNSSSDGSSFRRLEVVYVNAEIGGAYANVGKFVNNPSQGGLGLGLGAGVRFFLFTAGIRGRVAPLPAYTLIEANLEFGVHVPLGAWDPYFNLHGGYADAVMNTEASGAIGGVSLSTTPASPNGGDFGGSFGTDYYFSSLLSLGVDLTLDALFLSTGSTTYVIPVLGPVSYGGQSGTGLAFLGSLHFGLHFDL